MLEFPILADAALKGSMVLGVAAVAAWCLRGRSAAARHLVWTAAAGALLALPLLTAILPELRVPARTQGALAVFQAFSSGRVDAGRAPQVSTPSAEAAVQPNGRPAIDWGRWAAVIWGAGAAAGLLQMLLACGAVWRLRRNARPLDDGGVAAALSIGDRVEILESAACGMPMTFGLLRPTVLLPAGVAEWRPERLRVVLLHELAHVRRGDVATHLLARTALALYWWNPLAWLAWRSFIRERERATDDLVLHAGERASEYASHLLEVARSLKPAPATAWAAIAMARRSELEGRLIAILDNGVSRRPSGRRAPLAAAAAAAVLIAPVAAMRAQDPSIPPEAEATIRAANAQNNHEILDRAAAAYEKIARYDVARKLLESSLAIREPAGAASYAAGLVKLGDLAAKRGQSEEAFAFYSKAVSLGDRLEVAPALLYLGQRAIGAADRASAESYFERVLKLESAGPNAGRALMWLGVMRISSPGGDEPGAELYFQKSLAADPRGVTTLANYARLLRRQNRVTEAEELEARANEALHPRKAGTEAAIAGPPNVYRVGNGITAPSLLSKVEPAYSEEARAAKYQGTVLLYIEVAPDGTAQNIAVQRSLGLGLDEKAIEAVRQWRFKPGMKDGAPVTVAATIEVNFRLM
jgi:TonB family protein